MYKKLFSIVFCLIAHYANSQSYEFLKADSSDGKKELPRYLVIETKYQHGEHITTGVEALQETVESNPYNTFELRVGWRGYGRKRWQQLHNFLTYGVVLHHVAFEPYDNILGNPTSVCLYMDYPFLKTKNFWFGLDVAVGGAFRFKPYDPETNPQQKAIGSAVNLVFQPNLNLGFRLTNRFDFAIQAGLTHYSDGRMRTPNKGVNLIGLGLKAVYNIKPFYKDGRDPTSLPPRPENIKVVLPKHKNYFELMIAAGGGFTGSLSEYETKDDVYYGVMGLNLDGAYKYTHIGRIVLGVDVFFDESLVEEYENPINEKKFYGGVHIGHELLIHRFAVIVQYGRTFRDVLGRGKSYVIAGCRYHLSRKFFLKMVLKTPTELVADFALFGAGFTIDSRKRK